MTLIANINANMIPGKKSYKTCLWKKSTKRAVLDLAVLFDIGGWPGSKFGYLGPKFYGEPKSGFGSVGSARVSALPDISDFGW